MTDLETDESEAILDVLNEKKTKEQLLAERGWTEGVARARANSLWREALQARDYELVSLGIYLLGLFGETDLPYELLCAVVAADFHHSPEDLVDVLEARNEPEIDDILYGLALTKHAYLSFDETFALGVKCIFALARRGTTQARERLRLLAESDNLVLRKRARQLTGLEPDVD